MELRGYVMSHCYHQQREVVVYLDGKKIHVWTTEGESVGRSYWKYF